MSDAVPHGEVVALPQPRSRLDAIAEGLREELAIAQRELDEAQAVLDERKSTVQRVRRAVDALTAGPTSTSSPAGVRRGPGRPPKQQRIAGHYAPVSDKSVESTLQLLREIGEPQTIDALYHRVQGRGGGIGRDTIRRALLQARDNDRVRVAGRTERGGVLYALMPEERAGRADERADT
jgi:hypothetical protein